MTQIYEFRVGGTYTFRRYRIQYIDKKIINIGFSRFEKSFALGDLYEPTTADVLLCDLELYLPHYNKGKRFPKKLRKLLEMELVRLNI